MKKIAISLLVLALVAAFSATGVVSAATCAATTTTCASTTSAAVHELHSRQRAAAVPGPGNVLLSSSTCVPNKVQRQHRAEKCPCQQ